MPTKAEMSVQLAAQAKQIADLQRQLQSAQWALEAEQVRWTELSREYNAIYGMLDDLFGLKVWAAPGGDWRSEPEWVIEDKVTGTVLVDRCRPLAAAYYEAIQQRLAKKDEGNNGEPRTDQ